MEIPAKNIVSDETFCIWKGCILDFEAYLAHLNCWKLSNCWQGVVNGGAAEQSWFTCDVRTRVFATFSMNVLQILRTIMLMRLTLDNTSKKTMSGRKDIFIGLPQQMVMVQ